jgi:microcystin-dependent protein
MSVIQYVFGNFFETELTVGVTAAGTMLLVPPSATAALPICDPNVPSQAQLVLWDGVLPPEIVSCTNNPQTGALTVVRAQEGTTAQAWSAGTQVRSSLTALVINSALAAYFNIQMVLQAAFLPLTGGTLTGPLTLAADPVANLQAATKQYVDSVQGNKLPISGGTMQGTINMNNNRIVSLPAPVSTTEPVRLQEMNAEAAARIAYQSDNSGQLLTAGSSTAYTVTTNTGYSALVDGIAIKAKLHTANGRAATLTVDTTAAKLIVVDPLMVLSANSLQANMPLSFVYSLALDAWLVVGSIQPAWFPGDVRLTLRAAADPGWLLCNDQTIGNASSGAFYADIILQDLYTVLWTSVSQANAPVTGGRGASALADWNAQKPMLLTKMLGRALALAGTGAGLSARALGDAVGEETHLLTTPELPAHTHTATVSPNPHNHTVGPAPDNISQSLAPGGFGVATSGTTTYTTSSTSLTVTNANTGGGGPHNNIPPEGFLNAQIKY